MLQLDLYQLCQDKVLQEKLPLNNIDGVDVAGLPNQLAQQVEPEDTINKRNEQLGVAVASGVNGVNCSL